MPRKEFIEQAREILDHQKQGKERAEQIKLHDAGIVKTDGGKKWDAVKEEINAIVVTLSGSPSSELEIKVPFPNQITVSNKITNASVTIKFDSNTARIEYTGSGIGGGFVPKISGNELIYSADVQKFTQMQNKQRQSLEYSVEEMAEKMVGNVIGLNL